MWQVTKRGLTVLGLVNAQTIMHSIDPSLYDISLPAFKRQLKDKLLNEYSG